MGLLTTASVAIDGSKLAVNNRDKNLTCTKVERRRVQLEERVARYLSQLDTAERQEPGSMTHVGDATVETTRKKWCEADIYRIAGELAILSPARDAGIAHFERALAVAGEQRARSWEPRAVRTGFLGHIDCVPRQPD
jgi:hypothetical protein